MLENAGYPIPLACRDRYTFVMKPPVPPRALGVAIVLVSALAGVARAGVPGERLDPRFADVAQKMQAFIDQQDISGAVLLVEKRDGIAYLQAIGRADIAANRPMLPDSIFAIASMTKPLTATAIMMLQEEGKLSVDDPVAKYVPELGDLKTEDGKPGNLTLRHLLTHTSGMGEASGEESGNAKTLSDLIPVFAKKPLQFEPGTKWKYCQSGINTLGRIIEVASGQSYPDFLQKRLLDPLGMKDTTFYPTPEQVSRLATSYKHVDGKLEAAPLTTVFGHEIGAHDHYPAANGGLFSTAGDYGRFCRMLLNNGTVDGKTYLKPESVKQMTTIQTGDLVTGFTPGNGWGLGVCVVRSPQGVTESLSPGSFGHGGARGTQAWIDPVKGAAYVLMVQRTDFGNSDDSKVRNMFQETAAKALEK
jgi:CubicO group peptidase (beta-lactamase class C family)